MPFVPSERHENYMHAAGPLGYGDPGLQIRRRPPCPGPGTAFSLRPQTHMGIMMRGRAPCVLRAHLGLETLKAPAFPDPLGELGASCS